MKRENYITWEEYFMGIAHLSKERSKDPNTQVGACIVDQDNRIISIGYNGTPNGISDEDIPWAREGKPSETKYLYVCHSELNAIMNARGKDLTGCTIYVTLFPCPECAKVIIQSGIKKVIYDSDKYNGTEENMVSKKILDLANIPYEKYNSKGKKIDIEV